MATRWLLFVDSERLLAYRRRTGVLVAEEAFPAGEESHGRFLAFLERHSASIFTLLINVAEEAFHVDTIPYLRQAERKAVVARKLGQLFFGALLTAEQSLGYEKSTRKNERLLLAAFTTPSPLTPWLEAFRKTGAALAGAYSLACLGPRLLKKLGHADESCLFLSIQEQSLRQSYLSRGALHFSRLTPLPQRDAASLAASVSAETVRLRQYLTTQRAIADESPLPVFVLAHRSAIAAVQAACADTPSIRYVFVDLAASAQKCGLKTALPDSRAEPLFLHLLANDPPRLEFASEELRHPYHLRRLRVFLRFLSLLILPASLLPAGSLLLDARRLRQETAALVQAGDLARRRYDEAVQSLPRLPLPIDALRSTIDRYTRLAGTKTTPLGLYRDISHALQAVPSIELESIDWARDGRAAAATDTASTANTPAVGTSSESPTALVRGVLHAGGESGFRPQLEAFGHFVGALKANPARQVEVVQAPFGIESGRALTSEDGVLEGGKAHAFAVRITERPTP